MALRAYLLGDGALTTRERVYGALTGELQTQMQPHFAGAYQQRFGASSQQHQHRGGSRSRAMDSDSEPSSSVTPRIPLSARAGGVGGGGDAATYQYTSGAPSVTASDSASVYHATRGGGGGGLAVGAGDPSSGASTLRRQGVSDKDSIFILREQEGELEADGSFKSHSAPSSAAGSGLHLAASPSNRSVATAQQSTGMLSASSSSLQVRISRYKW